MAAESLFIDLDGRVRWLGPGDRIVPEGHASDLARVRDCSTVSPHVQMALRETARRMPSALVKGATRLEVKTVLGGAVLDVFPAPVTISDVVRGVPEPKGLLRELGFFAVGTSDAVVIEDLARHRGRNGGPSA